MSNPNLSVTYTCLYLFTIQIAGAGLNRSVEIPFGENTQCFDVLLQSSDVPGNVTMGYVTMGDYGLWWA